MAEYRFLIVSVVLVVLVLNVAEYKAMTVEQPNPVNQTTAAMMAEMSPEEAEKQGSSSSGSAVIYIAIRINVNNGCSSSGTCGDLGSRTCNNYCDRIGYNHHQCGRHYCKCCRNATNCR